MIPAARRGCSLLPALSTRAGLPPLKGSLRVPDTPAATPLHGTLLPRRRWTQGVLPPPHDCVPRGQTWQATLAGVTSGSALDRKNFSDM